MPYLLGEPALVLSKLEGEEAFSTLYTWTITARTPANPAIPWQSASNIDIKALLGKEMTIQIELDGNGLDGTRYVGKGIREISGLVQKARYVGRDSNQALYEIILRPWLHLAELTSDFKIYQQKTVVDIIDEVLGDYPYPVEKRLSATYPILDFQVQYGEVDFDFIERLMEEWGIYWFFEHSDHKHRLILVDHVGAHRRYFSEAYHIIHYVPDDPKADEEYISQFHHQETIVSGRWLTNDYDFTRSRADISAVDSKPRNTTYNNLELFHWPGDYEQPSIGEMLASVRMEERGAEGSRATGEGEIRGIVCGCNFVLTGYPVDKANREYMVLRSALNISEISQTSDVPVFSYHCDFTVQPTSKIYRHPLTIPRPRTRGPQTAIIVGPPGEDIWTDEYGRVKVRFVWDRYGQNRESDSCWLRVSQSWAGNNFGGIYIPRVGHEVIVDFINGDPDRPLIIGSLYNNVTMPPWDLPANRTQSGLISRTVGGGRTNYNGLRFEDKPGQELYWEQAERNMDRVTKNDETQTIGAHSAVTIGASRKMHVGTDYSKVVMGGYSKMVGLTYGLQVGLSRGVMVGLANSLDVGGMNATNVGGANLINVGGYHAESVGGAWQLAAGGAATMVAGGAISLSAGGELTLSAPTIKLVGSCKVVIQGGVVELNPGDCCGGGGGGGGGLGALSSLAGLIPVFGLICLPIPLPPLPPGPPPPTPLPTDSPSPTPTDSPSPTPTESPTPTPTESPTPTPTESPTPTPTESPTPTPTESPTPTPTESPTPTPTESPTPTPTESPTPTPTESPTPTPTESPTPTPTESPTPTPTESPTPTPTESPTPTPTESPTPTPTESPTPTPTESPTPTPTESPTPTPTESPTPTPTESPTPTPTPEPTEGPPSMWRRK
ncbi:type VI secretion system Vgr family protein [Lelliottia sp. CFBP8978]|uniref:type VI secretion system Vgr family protein n=1 Tax=Lelliottia sp. CFBP8978 TaxID=3096522 RepID=UPI002A6AEF15|nr:type VI secretion system tip protein TssI/VgrG [Lelliottia sp. CFBP8978]MDY1035621.1 type VI secretion system tip protein TssI/VgrG [Lelliottia sp. CFBP8978]